MANTRAFSHETSVFLNVRLGRRVFYCHPSRDGLISARTNRLGIHAPTCIRCKTALDKCNHEGDRIITATFAIQQEEVHKLRQEYLSLCLSSIINFDFYIISKRRKIILSFINNFIHLMALSLLISHVHRKLDVSCRETKFTEHNFIQQCFQCLDITFTFI